MKTTNKPAGNSFPVLRQLCNLIPLTMFDELCGRHGFDTRGYSERSHFVAMLYAHLSRAGSLNEVCDGLRMHAAVLARVKGATPPSKNNLSNCNKRRDAAFIEELYWRVMDFLCSTNGGFGSSKCRKGYLRRFRKAIHAADSTTVKLVAKNLGWAKHRRRKAAAKVYMRVGLQGFLPKFAVVKEARDHDAKLAREVCAGLQAGEIVVFDKAYLDLRHLALLDGRGMHWVTRAKENTCLTVLRRRKPCHPRVIADEEVRFEKPRSRELHPRTLRRVTARVEVDGREEVMAFLTNNLAWQSSWGHAFSRIAAVVRSALWQRWDLRALLHSYGTAPPASAMASGLKQAVFAGFS